MLREGLPLPLSALLRHGPEVAEAGDGFSLNPGPQNHRSHGTHVGKSVMHGGLSSDSNPSLSSAWVMDALETSMVINALGFRGNSLAVIFKMN